LFGLARGCVKAHHFIKQRNILFSNLINYCEDKVACNLYDTQFEYLAGDVIAMCNFELDNYDDAMNWYEFIALFYPDPDTRLTASWNYAEIEALIGSGTGGGEAELRIKNYELGIKSKDENAELNRLSEAITDDPVMRKLKRQFEKESGSKSGKTADSKLAEIHSDAVVKNTETAKSEIVKLKYDKARRNIFGSKGLSKQQLEADRMKDIALIAKGERRYTEISNITGVPTEFALHQNYPNPFNPVTNIEYDLPVDGNIELKIYDITGRLIKTLVNEFKTAGSYIVSFNASNLSSGVYFYSMNIDGKQTGVRRMTLVK
jgi:hypothetical protein